jgi:proteasome accessory factor A
LRWNDPWLESQDLEYHQVDPSRSLGLALADTSGPWADESTVDQALEHPPSSTRAAVRGALMREIAQTKAPYEIDWHRVERGTGESVLLMDPFQTKLI